MTTVVVKYPNDTRSQLLSLISQLAPGETIVSASIAGISPSGLAASISSFSTPTVTVNLGAGTDGISYGVNIDVVTSLPRTITLQLAVVINSQLAYEYRVKNPEAFNSLVDELEAGSGAIGRANFAFPTSFDASGGYVTWDLIDNEGVFYASGNAYDYSVTQTGLANKVEALAVITVPSQVPSTLDGQKYQIRWTLKIGESEYYSFENLRVTSPNTVPEGTEDAVELEGQNAALNFVIDKPYDHVGVEIYVGNQLLVPYTEVTEKQRVADGYYYSALIATGSGNGLAASLEPYTVMWVYYNTATAQRKNREPSRLYVTNPSILQATEDMRSMINKSRATIAHAEDILFTTQLLMAYLRRGMDAFNGSYGMLTSFNMTNARGSLREYWLRFSEIMALRSQFLAEGEKVFNFSGQQISLDVDRTSYYSGLADTIENTIDKDVKVFKQNLLKKGITSGDGDLSSIAFVPGSNGAVGITITPASNFSKYGGRFGRL